MKPRLILSDDTAERVRNLRAGIGDQPCIEVRLLPSHELEECSDLDAIYMSTLAAEGWGARPILHKAEVLRNCRSGCIGKPPFIVAGVGMAKEDPKDPVFELRLVVHSVLEAIVDYNAANVPIIHTVGLAPVWTGMGKLDVKVAGKIIRETYDDFHGDK